jgi:hypothetical protein
MRPIEICNCDTFFVGIIKKTKAEENSVKRTALTEVTFGDLVRLVGFVFWDYMHWKCLKSST